MIKIKASPFTCKIGDQVAVDIFNQYGLLIVAKNTIINEYILKNLINMGIKDFWIFRAAQKRQSAGIDPELDEFYENYENNIKTLKKIIQNLSNDDQADINNLDMISDFIFSEMACNQYLVKFLCDIKNHDNYTFEHSLNVAFYSALICRWMNLTEKKTKNIIKTGLLHDIGKTKIPLDLLNKKEKLCSEELKVIQKHAMYGYNMIKEIISMDSDIKVGVLLHHEREDGSGYPNRYTGRQLNMNTKIVSIADTYDALTSDREYRGKYTPFTALDILMTEGLTTYDISIMNTFVNNLIFHYVGSQVLLNSGETGKVIHIPKYNITRPIIYVNSELVDLSKENQLNIVGIVNDTSVADQGNTGP